jgi:hypothetical protein
MTRITAMRRRSAGSILGFLTGSPDHRGAAVLAAAALALFVTACDSKPLTTTMNPPHPTPNCSTRGCGAPPMCSTGCQEVCGCCPCAAGERNGNLICTSRGCYEPAAVTDGGMDVGDGGSVCSLPFEGGPCEAAIGVFAFVNGACVQRTYGGCQGNGNRFATQEECLKTCAGDPVPGECPPNRVSREICLSCGPAGGCAKTATTCAIVCDKDAGSDVCADSGFACYDGVCQAAFCI